VIPFLFEEMRGSFEELVLFLGPSLLGHPWPLVGFYQTFDRGIISGFGRAVKEIGKAQRWYHEDRAVRRKSAIDTQIAIWIGTTA
jgi:hypothetical protein